jgi:hypothetical protein
MQSEPCKSKLLLVKKKCYCIFRVYLVTGTKNPDISQEGTFRISKRWPNPIPKLFFYITTLHSLKDGQTQFLRLFFGTHIASFPSAYASNIYYFFVREHGVHAGPKDYFVVAVVVIIGFV